jgi:MFS family permease
MNTPAGGAWFQLAVIALAQFLGMTIWFSATAVTPALADEFRMSRTGVSWLTMAVQAGFVAGTLAGAFANVADRIRARHLICSGALVAAVANAAVLAAPAGWILIVLRFLSGAALAAVYPPAMKLAASWFRDHRGFALGLLIGALTLGKAVPYLVTALFGGAWRLPVILASGLAVVGGLVVVLLAREGPYLSATAPFDPHAIRRILANRGARLAILGYLGHMWELYAMWTWVGVFATSSFVAAGLGPGSAAAGALAAFMAIGCGLAGCASAGYVADRAGKARVAGWAMAVSGLCSVLTMAAYGRAPMLTFLLVMVWGFAVVADSAQFSALVSEHAPPDHVGTALTFQTSVGFLLTMVTIDLLPRMADAVGWQYASLLLVPGPALGVVAMARLNGERRKP